MLEGTYTQTRMSVERWKSECIRRKKGDWRKFVQEALDAQLAAAQAVPVAPVLPSQAAAAPSPYLPPVPTELSDVVWEQAPEVPPYPAQTAHTGQIFHMPQYDHVTWNPRGLQCCGHNKALTGGVWSGGRCAPGGGRAGERSALGVQPEHLLP